VKWLLFLVCMAVAPVSAARLRRKTLQGLTVPPVALGLGFVLDAQAKTLPTGTSAQWWLEVASLFAPPILCFGAAVWFLAFSSSAKAR
jgi:hypothetical protein